MKELIGHTTPDTAYVVDDYPYGFRLRTQIRYWIETKAGHGQRVVSQTRDPKRAGQPWNKPKAGIYSPILALILDEQGHVTNDGISFYTDADKIEAFAARYPLTMADARNAQQLQYLRAQCRAAARVTWTVRTSQPGDEPGQTMQEQAEIMRKLTAIELSKLRAEQESK